MTNDAARVKKVEQATEGVLRWLGFLQHHALNIGFVDKFDDSPYSGMSECRCEDGYPYSYVKMIWRRDVVDRAKPETLEFLAIHEALHTIFSPLDRLLSTCVKGKNWAAYLEQQEHIVDLMAHYLERRRPKYGYHPSGVCHTRKSATQKTGRSKR